MNTLITPASGNISFSRFAAGSDYLPPLSSSARIAYTSDGRLTIISTSSASERFSVEGNFGNLLSVNDAVTGTLFSVNDVSGFALLTIDADGSMTAAGSITALGGNSDQWNTAYTNLVQNSANYLSGASVSFVHSNFVHISGDYMTGALSISGTLSGSGQFATSNMLLGPNEGGAYFGRIGIRENTWQVLSATIGQRWIARESNRPWFAIAMSSDGRIQTAVCNSSNKIYTSNDYGITWIARGPTLSYRAVAMSSDGRIQLAASDTVNEYAYISDDYGVTWVSKGSQKQRYGAAISSDGRIMVTTTRNDKIDISYDYGETWTSVQSVRLWGPAAMSSDGRIIIVGVDDNGAGSALYISHDYGVTWFAKQSPRYWRGIAVSSDGRIQTAVVYGSSSVYTSYDYGLNWVQRAAPSFDFWYSMAMSSDGKIQIIGAAGNGVYLSTDYGRNWISTNLTGNAYGLAASSDGRVLAAVIGSGQIYISTASTITPNPITVLGTISATDSITTPTLSTNQIILSGGTRVAGLNTNIFIGDSTTGNDSIRGTNNLLFGLSAGRNITTGSNNTFIGQAAGRYVTTGTDNTFIGLSAGLTSFTGANNIIFGRLADISSSALSGAIVIGPGAVATQTNQIVLSTAAISIRSLSGAPTADASQQNAGPNLFIGNNTTGNNAVLGNHNLFFGLSAGTLAGNTCNNVFIGCAAGRNTTTSNNNTFIGIRAGMCSTGGYNLMIGYRAGERSTGGNSIFIGTRTGCTATGSSNIAMGSFAGNNLTTGNNNILIGDSVANSITTGNYNIVLGKNAGRGNSSRGCHNIFFGEKTGYNFTTGCYNVFFGRSAGFNTGFGMRNTFIGTCAGCTNTVGSDNIILGNKTDTNFNNLSGIIAIGNNIITTQTHQLVLSTAAISIRSLSGAPTADASQQNAGPNLFIGNNTTGNNTALGNHNLFFGLSAGRELTTGSNNFFAGCVAGRTVTTGSNNTIIGCNAGSRISTGSDNIMIGCNAGSRVTIQTGSVMIGSRAGINAGQAGAGSDNVFIGTNTGRNVINGNNVAIGANSFFQGSPDRSVAIGVLAGYNAGGIFNVFLGGYSGRNITGGSLNNFIGIRAGENSGSGSCNVFVGTYAGQYSETFNNVFVGYSAGRSVSFGGNNSVAIGNCALAGYYSYTYYTRYGATGQMNIAIGLYAGQCIRSGSSNILLGRSAGKRISSGTGNVIIGDYAGANPYPGGLGRGTGNNNIFLGTGTGYYNSTGGYNIFLGNNAGGYNITGCHNIALGLNALNSNKHGKFNIAIGESAGSSYSNYTADNIFIGRNTRTSTTILSGTIAIGCGTITTQHYQLAIGSNNENPPLSGILYGNLFVTRDIRTPTISALSATLTDGIYSPNTNFIISDNELEPGYGDNSATIAFVSSVNIISPLIRLSGSLVTSIPTISTQNDGSSLTWNPYYTLKSSDFYSDPGMKYMVDTRTGKVSSVVPQNPAIGTVITYMDAYKTWENNNFIIGYRDSIESFTESLSANVKGVTVILTYVGSTIGWRVQTQAT